MTLHRPTLLRPSSSPAYRKLLLLLALASTFLAACSSGPPTKIIVNDMSSPNIENLRVVRKVRCDYISSEARALGVDDAWLVSVDYDSDMVGHVSNWLTLYIRSDGAWYDGYVHQWPLAIEPVPLS